MLLSLITKNLNCEILTKNPLLKDRMGLRIKCAGSLKIRFIEGESRKTNILEGIAYKKRGGGLDSLQI